MPIAYRQQYFEFLISDPEERVGKREEVGWEYAGDAWGVGERNGGGHASGGGTWREGGSWSGEEDDSGGIGSLGMKVEQEARGGRGWGAARVLFGGDSVEKLPVHPLGARMDELVVEKGESRTRELVRAHVGHMQPHVASFLPTRLGTIAREAWSWEEHHPRAARARSRSSF